MVPDVRRSPATRPVAERFAPGGGRGRSRPRGLGRARLAPLLLSIGAWFTGPAPAGGQQPRGEEPVEGLLRLHHEQRVAHVLGDADLLAASLAAEWVEVSRGRVRSSSPRATREALADYLARVRFLEWEDVRPPRIRVSPGGAWAEVLVEKRVRTIPADTSGSKRQDAAGFAWSERWVRAADGWRLATLVSTDRPGDAATDAAAAAGEPDLADRVRAHEILRRGREAVGGEAAVARVGTLRFSADCEGPGGPFVTEVASARDGRVSFVQRFADRPTFAAGVDLRGPWRGTGGGAGEGADAARPDSLGGVLETVIAAHELHLLAIGPEARYRSPAARPGEVLDGREVHVVRFLDAAGAPASFLYDAATGLPAGFRIENHTGRGAREITTRFGDWRRVGAVRLPFSIAIAQGEDVYRYRMTGVSIDWLPDGAYGPPGE